MEPIKVKARKWGNSFGFVLPKKIVDERGIKEGMEISVDIGFNHKMTVGDLMELVKKHPLPKKINVKKTLKEVDEDFESKDE